MPDLVGVLKIINKLKEDGVISDFIIGGGVACTFHSEAVTTDDLDIFVLTPSPAPLILTYTPVYEALERLGAVWQGEYLVLHGIKLQFVFIEKGLAKESFEHPDYIELDGLTIKVEAPEYLIAKYTDIQRGKDLIKIHNLLRDSSVDFKKLKDILVRYNLLAKYNILVKKFGLDTLKEQKFVSEHSDKELFERKERYHKEMAHLPIKEKIEQINGILALSEQIKQIKERNMVKEGKEKSKKQVGYLLSKNSPLTKKQKDKLKDELHSGEVTIKEAYENSPKASSNVDFIIKSIDNLTLDINEPYNVDEKITASRLIVDVVEDALDSVCPDFFRLYDIKTAKFGKKQMGGSIVYLIPFTVIDKDTTNTIFWGEIKGEVMPFNGTENGAVKKVTIFNLQKEG